MPPRKLSVVKTMHVLQHDAFTPTLSDNGYLQLGKLGTQVQLKFIQDAKSLFGELSFGSEMLSDCHGTAISHQLFV